MNLKRLSSAILLVLLIALHAALPAFAHGDEPRLEISSDSLNPGDFLDIRGVDFEFEEEITLALVGPGTDLALGVVSGDTEGIFQIGIQLPVDLAAGTYTIHATTDDHVVESPPINVWGSADLGGGEEGAWEEGDSLLAPMPSPVPATAVPLVQPLASESADPQSPASSLMWVFVVLGVILLVAVLRVVKM